LTVRLLRGRLYSYLSFDKVTIVSRPISVESSHRNPSDH